MRFRKAWRGGRRLNRARKEERDRFVRPGEGGGGLERKGTKIEKGTRGRK